MKHTITSVNVTIEGTDEDIGWVLQSLAMLAGLMLVVRKFRDSGRAMGELLTGAEGQDVDSERVQKLMSEVARAQEMMFECVDVHAVLLGSRLVRTTPEPTTPDPVDLHPMPGVAQ